MSSPEPDPNSRDPDPALAERVARLEAAAVVVMAAPGLVPLLVGWVLPWVRTSGPDVTYRLATFGFLAFDPPAGEDRGSANLVLEGVIAGCYLLLDLMTVATAVLLVGMATRRWRGLRLGRAIVVLTLLCLVGATLMTLFSTFRNEIVPWGLLMWGLGVVWSAILFSARPLRAWWLPG